MSSQKLTELNLITSANTGDVLYIVTDYESGNPTLSGNSKQIYFSSITESMNIATLSNNIDNAIVTATGTSPKLNGENNLKISGTSLSLTGTTNVTGKGTYGTVRVGSATTTISATSVSTIITARKGTSQLFGSGIGSTVTNWTNLYTSNASEWNPTTGVFTATKSGLYRVSAVITWESHTSPSANTEYTLTISKNGIITESVGAFYVPISGVTAPAQVWAHAFVSLSTGNTLRCVAKQNTGSNLSLGTAANLNMITIEEVRTILTR